MKDLKERSRVRLHDDNARVLIGVMDETGILQYGQVFIQISKVVDQPEIEQRRIITSKIVIMKNPCIHPGDCRAFQGVDIPELHHLVDCVVFPMNGPRPHPNELSGSDLDGDQYHCIWDPRLIPTVPIKDPMDYDPAEKKEVDGPIGVQDMVDHTCEYIENDSLGMIANTHKALADQMDEGIESEVCLELAKMHSEAVDAPKTSNWQKIPSEIKDLLKKYPDFMMKEDKPSYTSYKVLGQMFKECKKYMSETAAPPEITLSGRHLDDAFKVEGYHVYLQTSEAIFKAYNAELRNIMRMYGIETEAEVVSGFISTVHSRLKNELDDVQENVRILMRKLQLKYHRIFDADPLLGMHDRKTEERKKAAAWYYVAYSHKYGETYTVGKLPCPKSFCLRCPIPEIEHKQEERHFLSFPWVMSHILADIYHENTTTKHIPHRSPHMMISERVKEIFDSLCECVSASTLNWKNLIAFRSMEAIYAQHCQLATTIDEAVYRFGSCIVFGSSAVLLFDEGVGDVSILAIRSRSRRPSSDADHRALLDRIHKEARSLFSHSRNDPSKMQLRVTVNKKIPRRRAIITADIASAQVWIVIKTYMFRTKWLFPVLKLLCSWMVNCGLVGGRGCFLPDYLVCLLFIDHCLQTGDLEQIDMQPCWDQFEAFQQDPINVWPFGSNEDWCKLLKDLAKSDYQTPWEGEHGRVGRLLCSFMKDGKKLLKSDMHGSLTQVKIV